jgi:hypothetical protein
MNRTTKLVIGGSMIVAIAAGGTGVAMASGGRPGDPGDVAITGPALQQASDAALAATGGGKVTQSDLSNEDSYYEVEVTLDDGSIVDVGLDKDFKVVSQDKEGPEQNDATEAPDQGDGDGESADG